MTDTSSPEFHPQSHQIVMRAEFGLAS